MTDEALSKMVPFAWAEIHGPGEGWTVRSARNQFEPDANVVPLFALSPAHIERVREMEAALKPFARIADAMPKAKRGGCYGYNGTLLTYEDFRAARAALPKTMEDGE